MRSSGFFILSGNKLFIIPLVLSIAALAACANPTRPVSSAVVGGVRNIEHWRLRARIGIVAEPESGAADLQWEQDSDSFVLKVTGAFGRSLVSIKGSPRSVSMQNNKGEESTAASAEELILQQTGWVIPVSGLRYWVLGLPSGLYRDETSNPDERGRLEKLQGGGWQVEYQRYGIYDEYQLPDKIRLQNGQVTIKLAVIDWEIFKD